MLSLFASGRLNPGTVLDGMYSLENWEDGFMAMEDGSNIKSVVTIGTAVPEASAIALPLESA